jgi:hypothetical protein
MMHDTQNHWDSGFYVLSGILKKLGNLTFLKLDFFLTSED